MEYEEPNFAGDFSQLEVRNVSVNKANGKVEGKVSAISINFDFLVLVGKQGCKLRSANTLFEFFYYKLSINSFNLMTRNCTDL